MPFTASNPEELRALVIALAAASAREPELRARVARWFRAGLELVEDGRRAGEAAALKGLASSLTRAADHAEFLAERSEKPRN